MKLFGQFLIEQGWITKGNYVKAMVTQANALPALPAAMNELGLLTVDQQVEVFDHQSTHLKDYRVACIELGYWDEEAFEHTLIRHYLSRARSLGDILLEQGCLTTEQLSDALAKYVELGDFKPVSAPPEIPKASKIECRLKPGPDVELEDDPFAFSSAEKTVCYLYCRFFNESRLQSIRRLSSDLNEDALKAARRDLTAIRTAALMIRADKSRLLIDALLRVTPNVSSHNGQDQRITHAINLLWELREGFSAGIPEALALQNKEFLNQANDTLASLSKIG
jgi:hypothetical protein